jgi:hypothetical protein
LLHVAVDSSRYTQQEVVFAVARDRNPDLTPPETCVMVYGPGQQHFGTYGLGAECCWCGTRGGERVASLQLQAAAPAKIVMEWWSRQQAALLNGSNMPSSLSELCTPSTVILQELRHSELHDGGSGVLPRLINNSSTTSSTHINDVMCHV